MYGEGNFAQFGKGPPPPPRPNINQQAQPLQPHVGQTAPPVYPHAAPAPVQQVQPGQRFLNPPPPPHSLPPPPPLRQIRGSTPPVHSYSNTQQNFQWTSNVHHLPPPVPPPFATGPENLRPPPPPRVLPPPPQGLQHTLLPPPPVSSFFMPSSFGSLEQPPIQGSHIPSMGFLPPPPPPPPSPPPGPPPLPPSSPPPNSPQPRSGTSSAAPLHSESGASSSKHSGRVADLVERSLAPHVITDDASSNDVLTNFKRGTASDLPPPPPKPRDEKIVRKIEVLCQYIAKNGPDFEYLTLQKEFGNPEFEFLFGGVPGSEAEAAHEYFVWMKRSCSLTSKLQGQQNNDSMLRPSRNDSPLQLDSSPADSDMDMEDDITQPVEEHRIHKPFDSPSHGSDLISLDNNNSTIGRPLTAITNPIEDAECPSDSNLEDFSICPRKDSTQFNASEVMSPAKVPGQHSDNASPFRLIQDYDSVESSGDVSPATVATSVKADDASFDEDTGPDFQMDPGSKSLDSSIELETIATKLDPVSIETGKAEQIADNSRGNQESIDGGTSRKAFKQEDATQGTKAGAPLESDKSTSLKVDEFGRLVREGASESDSDDVCYTKRRSKRGRSRSRSPHDRRRRSPRRRKEKRSRSRSWSLKKRSRSRSPFRRGSEFGGEKARWDKGQLPDCFDFRRGKCYRGASCRYLHHDSDKTDGSRHYKSKQQYQEVSPSSKHGEVKRQEIPESNFGDPHDENIYQKEVVSESKSLVTFVAESERAQEVTEALDIEKELVEQPPIHLTKNETDANARMLPGETSWIQQSEATIILDPVHQNTDNQTQQVDNSSFNPHSSENISSQSLASRDLPPPPPSSVSQRLGDFNVLQSSSIYHHQPPILYQHSHFSAPPNTFWHSLPPPPPPPLQSSIPPYINNLTTMNASTAPLGVFRPNLLRPFLADLPARSQVGGFQHQTYPSMNESAHPEDTTPSTFPGTNGGPTEDQFTRLQILGLNSSNSFIQGNLQQAMPFLGPPGSRMQSFFGEHGKINSTLSRYSSDFVSEFGSRIQSHYNPYASTFEQPLSSKFGTNTFNQEQEVPFGSKYGPSLSSSHTPVDGQGVGSLGSKDQYDPLFDSIEQSSKSVQGQKREPIDDSDSMLRLSGSNKPLSMEENKHKEASIENDEYGETADAEVGAVENGSPSDPIDEATTPAGEIEIDQVKSEGKTKKSKDSRSMKLFKGALADFVKEVLKPSWRQGNMSKEAFKTIVKKTVDKVSGAMKGHQIPKSPAKINHYIDSSQRKLTKLVMGYVDKYVKS